MSERRGKRAATTSSPAWSPSQATGMTKAQFCSIVCVFVAMTNWIDMNKSLVDGTDSTYCSRHFKYTAETDENGEEIALLCTESDLGIIAMKSHMTILRLVLALLVALMCWNNEGMLRSWNYAYAICPLLSQVVVSQAVDICRNSLKTSELRSILAVLTLSLASNYEGRQGRMPFNIKDGMHNILLYSLTIFGSYLVASHLIDGPKGYTPYSDFTAGGEALWIISIVTDYAMMMFTVTFGLFFFDNQRKKVRLGIKCIDFLTSVTVHPSQIFCQSNVYILQLLLFFMAAIFLVHAIYHLPMEKDIWIDAPARQTMCMGLFIVCIAGVVLPEFKKIEMKK